MLVSAALAYANQNVICGRISVRCEIVNLLNKKASTTSYPNIEMGAMDGVTMARKLRQDNHTVQIIFITGYADYISDGYEVDALHYLMKPLQEEKFFTVLDRAVTKLIKNEKVLNIISQGEMIRLPICQINYAEVNSNYITIHSQQTITLKMTLSELEKKLDSHFFRAGRSALVNLKKISRVTKKEIYLQDGSIIPLPRGAYEKVNRAIINMD
jgi:DNA-binding LytR/AlgR family response regulator